MDKTGTDCRCPFCGPDDCPVPPELEGGCGSCLPHRVDCVGLYCPVPVMRAQEEIAGLGPGEWMELTADDPAAREDIPRWAKRTGHQMLGIREENGVFTFRIRKKEDGDG